MPELDIACLGSFGTLPPELRIIVYDYIFGPTEIITPIKGARFSIHGDLLLQHALYVKAPIHTSILATNKMIFEESLDMLYRHRTVRGNMKQLRVLLRNSQFRELVRRVEIKDHAMAYTHNASTPKLLLQLQGLSRNRSTTILGDSLASDVYIERRFIPIPEFAIMAHLGEAVCVDIGRFQLSGEFSRIQIVCRKLVKMWPDVLNTPEDYDVYVDVLALLEAKGHILPIPNAVAWAAQTSLRRWASLYSEILCAGLDLQSHFSTKSSEQQFLLRRFLQSVKMIWHPGYEAFAHESSVRRPPLHMLRPGDDPSVLGWATELMSINILGYLGHDINQLTEPRESHWVGFDGGTHTLDIMAKHINLAMKGEIDAHFLSHPVFSNVMLETRIVRPLQSRYPQILRCAVYDLSPVQIRQYYLLLLATNHIQFGYDARSRQLVDDWSLQLLRRYLATHPSVHADEVERATLEDTRKAMDGVVCALARAGQKRLASFNAEAAKWRREYEPQGELDPDLAPVMAWEYGVVFVWVWRCVVSLRLGEPRPPLPFSRRLCNYLMRNVGD